MAFGKKNYPAKKRSKKPKINYEDQVQDELNEQEQPEEQPEEEVENQPGDIPPPQDGVEQKPVVVAEPDPGPPVVGKDFKFTPQVIAVPTLPRGTADATTHNPEQSPVFSSINARAKESLATAHHDALKTFHKTAKDMIEANFPEPTRKKSIMRSIISKWLGGKQ